jgi:hypothetical protein
MQAREMTVPVELAHHLANISSGLPFLPASFYFVLNNRSYLTLSVKDLKFQSWCFVKFKGHFIFILEFAILNIFLIYSQYHWQVFIY